MWMLPSPTPRKLVSLLSYFYLDTYAVFSSLFNTVRSHIWLERFTVSPIWRLKKGCWCLYCIRLHLIWPQGFSDASALLGDGMNAYVAYKVSTRVGKNVDSLNSWWQTMSPVSLCCPCLLPQTSLAMFRCKAFTVRRRYSDFLGLHEKLAVKQSLQGCIIPPPPEKSVVGGCLPA